MQFYVAFYDNGNFNLATQLYTFIFHKKLTKSKIIRNMQHKKLQRIHLLRLREMQIKILDSIFR